jgi:hypothetical protein
MTTKLENLRTGGSLGSEVKGRKEELKEILACIVALFLQGVRLPQIPRKTYIFIFNLLRR